MRQLVTLILLLTALSSWSQDQLVSYSWDDDKVIAKVQVNIDPLLTDSALSEFQLDRPQLDSLIQLPKEKRITSSKWSIVKVSNKYLVLEKSLSDYASKVEARDLNLMESSTGGGQTKWHWTFGVNELTKPHVTTVNNVTTFFLEGYDQAQHVYLSGSFNNWSRTSLAMEKTDGGWMGSINLEPGAYQYKFIVDNKWVEHKINKQSAPDGFWGNNSIYFVPNHEFLLRGNDDARKVVVSGNFNGWSTKQLKMIKNDYGWHLPAYIAQGTYAYKFIVDGNWLLDPKNPLQRQDDEGNQNNVLNIGTPTHFSLDGYTSAHEVILSGSFNNWAPREVPMTKTTTGWEIDYVLPPGNYEYKFVVDGTWITDPHNPLMTGTGDYVNSFISVHPNWTFELTHQGPMEHVQVSGNFNNWSLDGYPMERQGDKWVVHLYLPTGKCIYKFLVNGRWLVDPHNDLYEHN
ncbi:MAG: hypothetical protein HRT74_14065, partial [Flavobacteriales bacterium]|nr:hypothetical protein [Flavobacteriales bacterium]